MSAEPGASPVIPAPGFADPTRDAQRAFRAVLDAMAHPTRRFPLAGPEGVPATLGAGLGAVALTILDEDCSAWFGGALGNEEAAAWLVFHTGVRLVADPADADFVFATPDSLPALDGLQLGTDEAPHRSATVVLDTRGCDGSARFRAEGPGIDGAATLDAAWADGDFLAAWQRNGTLFPRGVDLLLVGGNTVDALPRTTRLTAAKTVAKPDREG